VPAAANEQVAAISLPDPGQFYKEAAAVDPKTGIVYQTEDLNPGGIFRFVPTRPGTLAGGKFQVLGIADRPALDTRSGFVPGTRLPIVWYDFPTEIPGYEHDRGIVFETALALGAAIFDRPEGMWESRSSIFFATTGGGIADNGQIWEIRENPGGQSFLELVYESPDSEVLDNPDNITVSPRGNAIVLCEDGGGDQYVRFLSRNGQHVPFHPAGGESGRLSRQTSGLEPTA